MCVYVKYTHIHTSIYIHTFIHTHTFIYIVKPVLKEHPREDQNMVS